ncbi:MAG: cytochrome C oxidase subunit IV family protein [Saprospiraceae bacterium]|nr:cytochrome C oxidase subunit IV family protein [Saprospiraceae bacterium]MDG1717386.1 cytochrome C oxidase subunit IV family protein [Saprospiraceae bacterium]|tara:strand:+ start:2356 stop:2769 length:414 start_codon:yes stop_codon:yes gene_type:complete
MGHMTYEQSKSVALKLIIVLAVITILEVAIALVGKGYIIEGFHAPIFVMAILMIGLSLYKAYKIVYEFMHLGHEVPGLLKSVLLPVLLLVWAIIAFFWEGSDWNARRTLIDNKNKEEVGVNTPTTMDIKQWEKESLV